MPETATVRSIARRRGTALLEFVLVIPTMGFFIALIFFFGWAMTNQQHVFSTSRYAAWKQAARQQPDVSADPNQPFFDGKADSVRVDYLDGADGTARDLAADKRLDQLPSLLAQEMFTKSFPRGSEADVSAHFPTSVGLWSQLQGRIAFRHTRQGTAWRYIDGAHPEGDVVEVFLTPLDTNLPKNNSLSDEIRHLCQGLWPTPGSQ